MAKKHAKTKAILEKAQKERDELSKVHLITTSEELSVTIKEINNNKKLSASQKKKRVSINTRTN